MLNVPTAIPFVLAASGTATPLVRSRPAGDMRAGPADCGAACASRWRCPSTSPGISMPPGVRAGEPFSLLESRFDGSSA